MTRRKKPTVDEEVETETSEEQPQETVDVREKVATSIGVELLDAAMTELKLTKEWQNAPAAKQDEIYDRVRDRIVAAVNHAVVVIASDGRTIVQGGLDQVTIKDGVKAVVKIGREAENLIDLYEAQGKPVLLVVADAKPLLSGVEKIHGEPDQRSFDMGAEYTDQDGDGMGDTVDEAGNVVIDAPELEDHSGDEDEGAIE